MQNSESTLAPELELLKRELDDLVEARGWTPMGYYFDDSPFDGIHLIKENDIWKLYWIRPGSSNVELRFTSLKDAFQNMLAAVSTMKQEEAELSAAEPLTPFSLEPGGPAESDVPSEDADEEDEEGDPVDTVFVMLFLLLILVLATAILTPFSAFLSALVLGY